MIGTGQMEQNPKATAPAWPYWSQDFRENSVPGSLLSLSLPGNSAGGQDRD